MLSVVSAGRPATAQQVPRALHTQILGNLALAACSSAKIFCSLSPEKSFMFQEFRRKKVKICECPYMTHGPHWSGVERDLLPEVKPQTLNALLLQLKTHVTPR